MTYLRIIHQVFCVWVCMSCVYALVVYTLLVVCMYCSFHRFRCLRHQKSTSGRSDCFYGCECAFVVYAYCSGQSWFTHAGFFWHKWHTRECFISPSGYGVATISRLLKMIGLYCKRAQEKTLYSAKETYSFKEPLMEAYRASIRWWKRIETERWTKQRRGGGHVHELDPL